MKYFYILKIDLLAFIINLVMIIIIRYVILLRPMYICIIFENKIERTFGLFEHVNSEN